LLYKFAKVKILTAGWCQS